MCFFDFEKWRLSMFLEVFVKKKKKKKHMWFMIRQTIKNYRYLKRQQEFWMPVNGQLRKGKRIYRKAKVVSWTPKPRDAALLNGRFSYFSNTHACMHTHKHTHRHAHSRVSAGWPDAQRSRHSEGARELQLQCRCSLPYFIFTAQHWAEPEYTGRNKHIRTCWHVWQRRDKTLTLELNAASRSKAFNLTLRPSYHKNHKY